MNQRENVSPARFPYVMTYKVSCDGSSFCMFIRWASGLLQHTRETACGKQQDQLYAILKEHQLSKAAAAFAGNAENFLAQQNNLGYTSSLPKSSACVLLSGHRNCPGQA